MSHATVALDQPGGWRGAWTPRRARLWLAMAIAAGWLPVLGMPMRDWLDFSAFYAGGTLAFTPDVLDLGAVERLQAVLDIPNTPFLYPPGLAILYVPFTWLPYDLAAAVHVMLQGAILLAAAVVGAAAFGLDRRWAILGTLAWTPAAGAVISGQNSAALLLLTVAAAWLLARGAHGRAGLVAGLAAYRPHLGLPITGLLAVRGAGRAVVAAALVLGFHYAAGIVGTGGALDWPAPWLATVAAETANDFASVGWQAIGLPGILGRLSVGGSTPGSLLGPAIVGYAIGGLLILSALRELRTWDAPRAIALACALALFAGPRGFAYDATLLLPAMAVLVHDASRRGWPWQDRWLVAGAYAIALVWPVGGFLGLNPLALLVLAAPFVLLGRGPLGRFAPTSVGILGRP